MQPLFEGDVYSKNMVHTHWDTYLQSRVLTWHGTVPPSVSPLDSGTKYGMPWGLVRTDDCVCRCSQTYSSLPMDKITEGIHHKLKIS